jgi:predicted nucleic acid-binding protein
MGGVLIDANVLLDLFTDDPNWAAWSEERLQALMGREALHINPIIYAEVSVGFQHQEELDAALSGIQPLMLPLCKASGFLAGKAFLRYRQAGGARRSPLPDFYIGAQAAVQGLRLLTRDGTRYKTYFPDVTLIEPEVI